jgi:hypothetical protein
MELEYSGFVAGGNQTGGLLSTTEEWTAATLNSTLTAS